MTAAPAPFIIRVANAADYEAEADVISRAFAAGPYGHLPLSDARRAFERDSFGRAASGTLLVAVDPDEHVIGSASLLRGATEYTRISRPDEAELRLLAVDPEVQSAGAGAALVRACLDAALEWGATALVLDTGSLNTRAQGLYERLGFERVPAREEALDDGDVASVVYAYPLQEREDVRVRLMLDRETDAVAELSERAYAADYVLAESYRASIVAVADRARENQVWVAEDAASGALIGTVSTPRAGRAISPLAQDGELDFRLLGVAPEARRRGIGELLTRHVLRLGRIRGIDRVVMNSGPEMTAAHRLYDRLGFDRLTDREVEIERGDGTSFFLLTFGYDLVG